MQSMRLVRPLGYEQILSMLNGQGFDFQELCKIRNVPAEPDLSKGELRLTGIAGNRRVPIHSSIDIEAFLSNAKETRLPTIEAQLPGSSVLADPKLAHKQGLEAGRKRGRDPRDQIEELEDANFKLTRAFTKVERRLSELERLLASNDERNKRVIDHSQKAVLEKLDRSLAELNDQVGQLKEDDATILQKLDVVRQHGFAVEQADNQHHSEILEQLDAFGQKVDEQFDEVNVELTRQKEEDARLDAEAQETKQNLQDQLDSHLDELQRLEEVKVNMTVWKKHEDEMAARITKDLDEMHKHFTHEVNHLTGRFEEEQRSTHERFAQESNERSQGDAEICRQLKETTQRIDNRIQKLDEDTQAGFKAAAEALEDTCQELTKHIDDKINDLSERTEKRFDNTDETIAFKDKKINERTDELTAKTMATFTSLDERLQEMARQERARLGQIEKELQETATKIRMDTRADVERVRSDYEQDASRLDADLQDVHYKHDVTKQEINFFQTKLKEQRDWTETKLTENSTATRAAVVDSQEGLAASTKMLCALRDDAVGFREKMAKYISLLQHSCDSQGDAINSLDQNRSRMRAELDALIGDHKCYTDDMDGWAQHVTQQVERLFRAFQPAKIEWRVARATQRAKELKKPLPLKSPSFSIKGIREGHMEFFPSGHNHSPEGKAVLRVYLPPQAHCRYQCWVGRFTEGPRDCTPGENLNVDFYIDDWKEYIDEYGTVPITMEVLRDYTNDDASLAREIRIQSD